MTHARNPLQANKLLLSKWTAAFPVNKEKHFLVVKVLAPATPDGAATEIELEAVHSKRSRTIAWRELGDASHWLQGWR